MENVIKLIGKILQKNRVLIWFLVVLNKGQYLRSVIMSIAKKTRDVASPLYTDDEYLKENTKQIKERLKLEIFGGYI